LQIVTIIDKRVAEYYENDDDDGDLYKERTNRKKIYSHKNER
jgi:hypothetical protein